MRTTIMTLMLGIALAVLAACNPNGDKNAQSATVQMPAPEDVVMYQVNPRVFAPEKSLNAVLERIDSIADLGVNVVWVMPIYPIGEIKSKNSPYSIKDYKAIAPEFGTPEDFKALVDACHERGMCLILDWVANHTAWDNVWMTEGHKDWYTQDSLGNVIFPPKTDWTDVADLNYDNSDMRAAMRDAMLFWVKEMGVDGFRCDVADWVPADFWKGAIDSLRTAAGDRHILMLAEGNDPKTFAAGFDMNYAWDFKNELLKVFNDGEQASKLFEADKAEYEKLPAGKVKLRFTTNHDHSNTITPVKEFVNARGSMAAYVVTVFLHGGALIYGSQEVGYPDPINFFHYVPVDWSANGDMYKEYQTLIKVYNDNPDLRHGAPVAYPAKDVAVFEKGDGHYLVIVNVRDSEQKADVPSSWVGAEATDLMTGQPIKLEAQLALKPFEYRLLKK